MTKPCEFCKKATEETKAIPNVSEYVTATKSEKTTTSCRNCFIAMNTAYNGLPVQEDNEKAGLFWDSIK